MRKNFFSGMPLGRLIEIIEGLAIHGLFPSEEMFQVLYELERSGEDVEGSIPQHFWSGRILSKYREFKGEPQNERYTPTKEATPLQEEFVVTVQTDHVFASSWKRDLTAFEKIYLLHLKFVPVFTMMYEAGQDDMASAYREWLFARSPSLETAV